ncbi:MAG: hypothetical protein ABEH56_01835 [Salinirussus sp.]
MASASPTRTDGPARHRIGLETVRRQLASVVRSVGFWAAVALPFVVLSLITTGAADGSPFLVGGLLAANVAALVVGRNHNR